MNRLADVLNILGIIGLTACAVIIMMGEKSRPEWASSRVIFIVCSSSVLATIIALAITKSWGSDSTNRMISGICCIWALILGVIFIFF